LPAACGLRTIALFGPQDPARRAPTGDPAHVIHPVRSAPCIPCGRRECVNPVRGLCMHDITAVEVARWVRSPPPPRPAAEPALALAVPQPGVAERVTRSVSWRLLIVPAAFLLGLIGGGSWVTRLDQAAAVAATVLVTICLARRLGNNRTAIMAGLCLLAMWGYSWSPGQEVVDLDAACLVTASLFFYLEADRPVSWLGDWGFVL